MELLAKFRSLDVIEELRKRGYKVGTPKAFNYIRIIKGDEDLLVELQQDPRVVWVECECSESKNDVSTSTINQRLNNNPMYWENMAWQLGRVGLGTDFQHLRETDTDLYYTSPTDGRGVKIIVIDDGIRTSHVNFADINTTLIYSHDGKEYDVDNNHGTMCASQAVGMPCGTAKKADLLFCRVKTLDGGFSTTSLVRCLDEAYNLIDSTPEDTYVVSLSIGSNSSNRYKDFVNAFMEKGVIVVASSGNYDDAVPVYPATHKNVLSVGAIDEMEQRARWSEEYASTYGSTVDVHAPGKYNLAAGVTADDEWIYGNGTSAAAPVVAGLVALHIQGRKMNNVMDVRDAVSDFMSQADTNTIQWEDPTNYSEVNTMNKVARAPKLSPDNQTNGSAPNFRFKRGNAVDVANYLGEEGELVIDTDNQHLYYHDGVTVGGLRIT